MAFNQYGDVKKREKIYADKFNNTYKGLFEYCSGFKDIDSPFISRCLICGTEQERNAQCIRKHRPIKCNRCIEIKADNKARQQKIDSDIKNHERERNNNLKKNQTKIPYLLTCNQCGIEFDSNRKDGKFCSTNCRNKYFNKQKEVERNQKLKENGKIDWSITLEKLYDRDKGKCHICGFVCDFNDFEYTGELDTSVFIAGNRYPSIDHIQSVNKGGTHTWDNIKLAHRICNSIKRDDDTYEINGGQIM
ncbi:MAG: HNH endonuclease, partial [Prevotella sp.]|nr:HNH endonuclease [Prevotella sp.]